MNNDGSASSARVWRAAIKKRAAAAHIALARDTAGLRRKAPTCESADEIARIRAGAFDISSANRDIPNDILQMSAETIADGEPPRKPKWNRVALPILVVPGHPLMSELGHISSFAFSERGGRAISRHSTRPMLFTGLRCKLREWARDQVRHFAGDQAASTALQILGSVRPAVLNLLSAN